VRFHRAKNIRHSRKSPHRNAYTLLEITLVIGIVVGLSAVTVFGLGNFSAMARASRAEAALRMVESARLSFLSDNPQVPLGSVNRANLNPYIPGGFDTVDSILRDNGYGIAVPADLQTPRIGYRFQPGTTVTLKGFEQR
jgi:type II secretory pathway pseudopilin PulG